MLQTEPRGQTDPRIQTDPREVPAPVKNGLVQAMPAPSSVKIGLVQAASAAGVPAHNIETIRIYADRAAEAGCAAVCFPEGFLTGYSLRPENCAIDPGESCIYSGGSHSQAQQAGGGYSQAQQAGSGHSQAQHPDTRCGAAGGGALHPALVSVSRIAARFSIDLLVGFLEYEHASGHYFITHGLFRPDGSTFFYRKTHLGEKEEKVFSAGDTLPVFPLSCGLTAAVQLCVEAHFPEITLTYSLKGAEIVFAPFAVPGTGARRKEIWGKYIPARSYDNRVYMACCNLLDERRSGGCLFTGPDGDILAEDFTGDEGLIVCSVDRNAVSAYHPDDCGHPTGPVQSGGTESSGISGRARGPSHPAGPGDGLSAQSGTAAPAQPDMHRRYYPAKRRPELYRR